MRFSEGSFRARSTCSSLLVAKSYHLTGWFRSSVPIYHSVALLVLIGSLLSASGCTTLSTHKQQAEPIAIEANPIDPAIQKRADLMYEVLAGEISGKLGDVEAASEHYLEAAKLTDDPSVAARTARIALFAKDYEKAYEAAARWVELEPDNNDAQQTLGLLLVRLERPKEAAEHFAKVIDAAGPDHYEASFAQLNLLLGREAVTDTELQVLDILRKRYPKVVDAQRTYAELAYRGQDYEKALAGVEDALAIDPKDQRSLVIKNRALLSLGRVDEALANMRSLLQEHPQDPALYHNYARMLVQAKRYGEALEAYQEVLRLQPDDPDIVYSKALLEIELKKYTDARKSLQALLDSPHHHDEASYYLGRVSEDQGRLEEAIDWYKQVEEGEYYFDAQTRIAEAMASTGRLEAARAYLQTLRNQIDDQDAVVRLLLVEGQLLADQQQDQAAYDFYDEALKKYPDNSDLLYARAMMAERIGHVDWLERDLKRLLAKEPDNATALNALGYTLADRTERYQEAYQYIQQALKIRPDDAAILDSMGWVEYKLGDLQAALKYLRQAYAQMKDTEIAYHLGEVLLALGQRDEAEKLVLGALAESPDDVRLQTLLEKLKQ